VTFALTLVFFFLPAMVLINAVVEPEFLNKLRVRIFVAFAWRFQHHTLVAFWGGYLIHWQGGVSIGSQFRVRLE
jgi:hypothetical protein